MHFCWRCNYSSPSLTVIPIVEIEFVCFGVWVVVLGIKLKVKCTQVGTAPRKTLHPGRHSTRQVLHISRHCT